MTKLGLTFHVSCAEETTHTKCQMLFSWKPRKMFNLLSAAFAQRVLKVKVNKTQITLNLKVPFNSVGNESLKYIFLFVQANKD